MSDPPRFPWPFIELLYENCGVDFATVLSLLSVDRREAAMRRLFIAVYGLFVIGKRAYDATGLPCVLDASRVDELVVRYKGCWIYQRPTRAQLVCPHTTRLEIGYDGIGFMLSPRNKALHNVLQLRLLRISTNLRFAPFPPNLTYLHLGYGFNIPLHELHLPPGLLYLSVGHSFRQTILLDRLPAQLKTLSCANRMFRVDNTLVPQEKIWHGSTTLYRVDPHPRQSGKYSVSSIESTTF